MMILADENIDLNIIERLRKDGHIVLSVAEMAPSISDLTVINAANDKKADLVSQAFRYHAEEIKNSFSVLTPGILRTRHPFKK